MLELDGNILLSGFKNVGYADVTVVKQLVSQHAQKLSEKQPFSQLALHLKKVHGTTDDNGRFELKAKLDMTSNVLYANTTEHNIFAAVDSIMTKIENQIKI